MERPSTQEGCPGGYEIGQFPVQRDVFVPNRFAKLGRGGNGAHCVNPAKETAGLSGQGFMQQSPVEVKGAGIICLSRKNQ